MPGRPASPQHVAWRGALAKGVQLAISGWGSPALQWGRVRVTIQVPGNSFSSTKTRRQ